MVKPFRFSKKREAIFDALRAEDSHPSAEQLYKSLKTKYPDLSLGTVYRNLSRFKQEGSIASVGIVRGQERFDGDSVPHPHFICGKCGGVFDIHELSQNPELNSKVAELFGCTIDYHELTFHGTCRFCNPKT